MMEGNTRSKRKRVSKNKKKSWRKHTDITDVEEALDDERLQQRTGGLVAEKTDESLFFVDKSTEEDSVKQKRGLISLRCYSNLEPDPQTIAALIPRNPRKRKAKKKDSVTSKKSKKALDAEEQRLAAVRQRQLKQTRSKTLPVVTQDLWADVNPQKEASLTSFHMEYTRKKPVKPPKTYRDSTSGLPAVDVPHPGASYNPSFDDHQDLLTKANQIEVVKEKKEKLVEKSLDEKFPTKAEAPTEDTWIKEMSAGFGDNEESDISEDENDRLSVNPVVRREDKKTLRQRRQEKERKAREKAQRLGKVEKQKVSEFFRLKSMKADVKSREKQLEDRKNRKETLKEFYKNKPKKLGKLRFEEPDVEIKLSDELAGSLRELKPEGHLLEDRFKAFQRRNMIETRKRTKFVRKYKPKKFEKKGHKAIQI